MSDYHDPRPEQGLHDLFTRIGERVEFDPAFDARLRQQLARKINLRRRHEQDENTMNAKSKWLLTFSMSFVGILAVALLGSVLWNARSDNSGEAIAAGQPYKSPYAGLAQEITYDGAGGISLGDPGAPVTLVEYSDFSCLHDCTLSGGTDRLIDNYVRPGTLRIIYKPLTFVNPATSQPAAAAVLCAASGGKGWEMREQIWELYNLSKDTTLYTPAELRAAAEKIGLDGAEMANCLETSKTQKILQSIEEEADALGVVGSPTIYLNGEVIAGAISYEELAVMINTLLASSKNKETKSASNSVPDDTSSKNKDKDTKAASNSAPGNILYTAGESLAITRLELNHKKDTLILDLQWMVLFASDEDYTIFVHVKNEAGQVVAQFDQEMLSDTSPTSLWAAGAVVDDQIKIKLDLKAGTYYVLLGIYRTGGEKRLPLQAASGESFPDHMLKAGKLEIP